MCGDGPDAESWQARAARASARLLLIAAAILAVVVALVMQRVVLLPVALALVIAAALQPAYAWLCRHRLPAALSAALVLVLLGVVLGGAFAGVVGVFLAVPATAVLITVVSELRAAGVFGPAVEGGPPDAGRA